MPFRRKFDNFLTLMKSSCYEWEWNKENTYTVDNKWFFKYIYIGRAIFRMIEKQARISSM